MTATEAAIVRDLHARLRLAEERTARAERERDALVRRVEKRIAYLERDKQRALERARKAVDQGRYWHGVAIASGAMT